MVHYSRGHSCPYTLATPSRTGPGRKCGHTERHRDVVGERGRIVPVPHVHMQLGFVDYEWSTTLEGTCVFTHLLHHRARDPAESVDIRSDTEMWEEGGRIVPVPEIRWVCTGSRVHEAPQHAAPQVQAMSIPE